MSEQDRKAVGAIFKQFNDLMLAGDFERCDQLLRDAEEKTPASISPTMTVSLLAITLAAKSKLRFRGPLFEKTKSGLLSTYGEDRTKRILAGLE